MTMKPDPLRRCSAVLVILDDRWGSFRDECELDEGHEGEHSIAYTATVPPAHMRWSDAGSSS